MKANEAPKKIYISINSQDGTYYISNQYKRLIEYTRTDAFIEKACAWLNENANKYWGTEFVDSGEMVEDFRKYLEGELTMEVSYSSSAEGFVFNGWRYFWLGVDSYEQFYY